VAGGLASGLVVAVAQLRPVAGDKSRNLEQAGRAMADAASRGASAIVFPELFLTGYGFWDGVHDLAEEAHGPAIGRLMELAGRHRLVTVCGFPERLDDKRVANSACVIDSDGTLVGVHRKVHLFRGEADLFTAGNALATFETSLGRIGVLICYDLEFPEAARVLALGGARILFVPTASMDPYRDYQRSYAKARAMENGVYLALVNNIGEDDRYTYFGESLIVDPEGRVLAEAASTDALVVAEIEPGLVERVQERTKYLQRRRPELYAPLLSAGDATSAPSEAS
jgi:predicted amidohydrolase